MNLQFQAQYKRKDEKLNRYNLLIVLNFIFMKQHINAFDFLRHSWVKRHIIQYT